MTNSIRRLRSLLAGTFLLIACTEVLPSDAPACTDGEIIAPYDGPICTDDSYDCFRECSDPARAEECTEACFAADPDCETCFSTELASCFNETCQAEWDAFACCTDLECEGAIGVERARCAIDQDLCLAEYDAWVACVGSVSSSGCGTRISTRCNF